MVWWADEALDAVEGVEILVRGGCNVAEIKVQQGGEAIGLGVEKEVVQV